MKNKKRNNNVALITGLAIAGAGAAYLYGTKDGKNKRKDIENWTMEAKKKVLTKVKKIKGIKETAYNEIVKNIVDSYSSMKDVNKKEIQALTKELKSGWKQLKSESSQMIKKPKAKKVLSKVKPKIKKVAGKTKKTLKK